MATEAASRKVRVALLGLGAAARDIHWPAARSLGELELVAGVDPDRAARERFARVAPRLPLHADAGELLRAEQPDWAVVAAPPPAHRELCLLALERGAHVFCEKPFVPSTADADAIIAAARRAGRAVAVNLEFPRMPIFAAALGAIGGRDLGRLRFFQAWQHLSEEPAGDGWRAAGQTLQEFGSHVVDLAVRSFGGLPRRVTAHMPRVPEAPEADLVDVVTLEFPGERVASIVLDRVCRGSHRYLELRLDGERASLRTSIGGRAHLSLFVSPRRRRPGARLELALGGRAWLEVGERRRSLARNPANAFAAATAQQLRAALAAVTRGDEPPTSAQYTRGIVAVVEAAYASARSGRSVELAAAAAQPEPAAPVIP